MTEIQASLFETTTIRLACIHCDREDFDGRKLEDAKDWIDVIEDDTDHGDLTWWTHTGLCPDCRPEWEEHYH